MKSRKNSRHATVSKTASAPTHEQIEALAHAIWVDRGCPEARDLDNWLEAERQLRGEVHIPQAADDIPASNEILDPEQAVTGKIERELDEITNPPKQRSPTSL